MRMHLRVCTVFVLVDWSLHSRFVAFDAVGLLSQVTALKNAVKNSLRDSGKGWFNLHERSRCVCVGWLFFAC
jgi:hypothetical protein